MTKLLLIPLILASSFIMLIAKPNNTPLEVTDLEKIQTIFKKRLRKKCRCGSVYFAQQHTQSEWNKINKNGLFKDEFLKLCPKGVGIMDDEWIELLFQFSYEYAKGTNKRPKI